jgi:hypothetical protein
VSGLLQVRAGIVFELSDQRLELSGFSSYTCGEFSITHTRCLVKCVSGREKLVGPFFCHRCFACGLTCIVLCFRYVSDP